MPKQHNIAIASTKVHRKSSTPGSQISTPRMEATTGAVADILFQTPIKEKTCVMLLYHYFARSTIPDSRSSPASYTAPGHPRKPQHACSLNALEGCHDNLGLNTSARSAMLLMHNRGFRAFVALTWLPQSLSPSHY